MRSSFNGGYHLSWVSDDGPVGRGAAGDRVLVKAADEHQHHDQEQNDDDDESHGFRVSFRFDWKRRDGPVLVEPLSFGGERLTTERERSDAGSADGAEVSGPAAAVTVGFDVAGPLNVRRAQRVQVDGLSVHAPGHAARVDVQGHFDGVAHASAPDAAELAARRIRRRGRSTSRPSNCDCTAAS